MKPRRKQSPKKPKPERFYHVIDLDAGKRITGYGFGSRTEAYLWIRDCVYNPRLYRVQAFDLVPVVRKRGGK